ncbi:hypothetical protein VTL71DRAFT_2261 [Oculimacula yallundae]|uniref:Uncharacterized protein n=1 Tax=Oculimacula yallundae TaxID=86028 RepID=A0ABR4C8V8_9HELO
MFNLISELRSLGSTDPDLHRASQSHHCSSDLFLFRAFPPTTIAVLRGRLPRCANPALRTADPQTLESKTQPQSIHPYTYIVIVQHTSLPFCAFQSLLLSPRQPRPPSTPTLTPALLSRLTSPAPALLETHHSLKSTYATRITAYHIGTVYVLVTMSFQRQ